MATKEGHGEARVGAEGGRVTKAVPKDGPFRGQRLKLLIGSGDKIGLFTLPFMLVGLLFNIVYPSAFNVGGPWTVTAAVVRDRGPVGAGQADMTA
jgi:hypothetical protein